MIYNLVQYLIVELPLINFISNGFNPDSEQDAVMLSESGGDPKHWFSRTDWAIQIISRGKDTNIARKNIYSVYDLLKNKLELILPEVTVDEIIYPAIKTYQMSPVQSPGYLGADEKHLEMFSFNLTVTTN